MSTEVLTAEAVKSLLLELLFTDEELAADHAGCTASAVRVQSVMHNLGFHPQRVADAAPRVRALLTELPDQFRVESGGGWSFLNLCQNREGRQWGEHIDCDRLVCLGLATGLLEFQLPREFWPMLPGGMPYVVVMLAGGETTTPGGAAQ